MFDTLIVGYFWAHYACHVFSHTRRLLYIYLIRKAYLQIGEVGVKLMFHGCKEREKSSIDVFWV